MNRLRYVIKAAAFLTVLCLCLGFFSVLLTPKYYQEDIYPTTSTFCEFYQLEKNSVDVLFLGSSHAVTAFDPCVLYENWGLTSYNLGSEQQSLLISYYWLKEALRYQKPSAVVLDTYFLFPYYNSSPINAKEAYLRKALDFMRRSPVFFEAVHEITKTEPEQSAVSYLFPGVRYHDRLHTLTEKDYQFSRLVHTEGLMGYGMLLYESEDERYEPIDMFGDADPDEMVPLMADCLDRIVSLCEENDIALILTKTPAVGQTAEKSQCTQNYADEHGLMFIDFNDSSVYFSELEYNFYSDNSDNEHANLWGANKITNYLGGILTDEWMLEGQEHPAWDALSDRHEARLEEMEAE